jgi:hypothetical protein
MSNPDDEFEPDRMIVDALVADQIEPQVRAFGRELGVPIAVDGHVAVRGQAGLTWSVPAGIPGSSVAAQGRAIFRRTGGRHILYRVQVRVPRPAGTSWTGIELEGWIRPDRDPVDIEPRRRVVLHNVVDWLTW